MALRSSFFFFNATATTEIYTLSLHDALPILRLELKAKRPAEALVYLRRYTVAVGDSLGGLIRAADWHLKMGDRKSTRLNSSHSSISYAVFCLKKKRLRLDLRRSRPEVRHDHQ